MRADVEFLLGLLDREFPAQVAQEDFEGPYGPLLRLCQRMGFLSTEPGVNPVPSCPHCGEGVPFRLGGRYRCNRCWSAVESTHLLLWRFELDTLLGWLADKLRLRSGVRRLDGQLWQLGACESGEECFYWRSATLTEHEQRRLTAYRNVVLLYGLQPPVMPLLAPAPRVSLLELIQLGDSALTVRMLPELLRRSGDVRFDDLSGGVWIGDVQLGEVPVGTKEHGLLACLRQRLDQFVPYADIKHFVLQRSGSRDTTEEATFCQRLKNRIKSKYVPEIDRLIATTNKADGYRLRAQVREA